MSGASLQMWVVKQALMPETAGQKLGCIATQTKITQQLQGPEDELNGEEKGELLTEGITAPVTGSCGEPA